MKDHSEYCENFKTKTQQSKIYKHKHTHIACIATQTEHIAKNGKETLFSFSQRSNKRTDVRSKYERVEAIICEKGFKLSNIIKSLCYRLSTSSVFLSDAFHWEGKEKF